MKQGGESYMKRILSILIVLTIVLTSFSVTSFAAEEKAALPTITVDMKNEQHNIIHGAAGFLYGLSCGYSLEKCGNIGSILSGEVIQVIGTELPDSKWEKIKEKIIMIN